MKILRKQYSKRDGDDSNLKNSNDQLKKATAITGASAGVGLGAAGIIKHRNYKNHLESANSHRAADFLDPGFEDNLENITPKEVRKGRVKELSKNSNKKLKQIIQERKDNSSRAYMDWLSSKETPGKLIKGNKASEKLEEALAAKSLKHSRQLRNVALGIGIPSATYLTYRGYKKYKKRNND